jgi:hypothetical protein
LKARTVGAISLSLTPAAARHPRCRAGPRSREGAHRPEADEQDRGSGRPGSRAVRRRPRSWCGSRQIALEAPRKSPRARRRRRGPRRCDPVLGLTGIRRLTQRRARTGFRFSGEASRISARPSLSYRVTRLHTDSAFRLRSICSARARSPTTSASSRRTGRRRGALPSARSAASGPRC